MRLSVCLPAIASAVLLVGCGGSSPTSSVDGSAPAATSPAIPAAGSTPGHVPVALPLHPDATAATPSGAAWAEWSVAAAPQAVYAFYLEALPSAGFVIGAAAPGGGAAIIRFSAPDGSEYQLDLTGAGPVRVRLSAPHD